MKTLPDALCNAQNQTRYGGNAISETQAPAPESINGWTPPTVYDVARGMRRIATQADIDSMERKLESLSRLFAAVRDEVEIVKSNAPYFVMAPR